MNPPDYTRLGGLEWARRTGGRLSRSERRTLLAAIVRGQGDYVHMRWRRLTGRVHAGARDLAFADVQPPDSRLAQLAEEAAEEQSVHVKGHGHRTWAFGAAFAVLDRHELDPEVFYVASLLHDYGVADVVRGEDFVLRSATIQSNKDPIWPSSSAMKPSADTAAQPMIVLPMMFPFACLDRLRRAGRAGR